VDNLNLSGNAITSTNTDGNIDLTPNGTGEVNITKVDIDAGTIDGTTIGGASAAAGTFTTLTATTLGGALDANNQAITNINVDSGAIDGTPIGANSASTGAFTTATATTGNITTVNATTVDTTNVEVTAIKAKDGTAAATIADSTGVVTIGSSVLTTADINGGTIDGTTIGGASAAAGTFTSLNSSSASTFNGGVVINELGADADTRIEGDTDANLFFVDASTDRIGIGTSSPSTKLHVYKALQIGQAASFWSATGSNFTTITNNAIFDGAYKYKNDGIATQYSMGTGGNHAWNIAASGTAGDPITFTQAMGLDASGNLGLGTTAAAGVRFDVRNDSTTTLADMRNANASGFGIYIAAGSSSSQYVQRWADYNNNALATLDASGNLCVGSTSPGNAGVINVSVGNPGTTVGGLQLWSTTSGTHYVQFGDSASGGDPYRGAVGYAHASDAMVFFTAGNERARITAGVICWLGKQQ
jgi:trimeric autotransporter adhesin